MSQAKTRNEAEIEAEIRSTVRHVFNFLPPDSLKHQKTFSVQLGRNSVKSSTGARLDILVTFNGKNLAVLELKAQGVSLDDGDKKQGLSYASLLRPMPPLVVVTNTEEVEFIKTYTGEKWEPEGASEETVHRMFEAASKAAANDLKEAIGTLLGTNLDIWRQAVRGLSKDTIEVLTGEWRDYKKPFVSEFLIPRQVTRTVLEELNHGSKLVMVEGAPLLGKSNVLRELVKQTQDSDEFVVLFIEGYSDVGIFRKLSYMLRDSLSWHVTPEEVRHWLVTLSQHEKPALVLAIDGVRAEHNTVKSEIDELISGAFGNGIRVVLGVDDTVADSLVKSGRNETSIGRQVKRIVLEPLSDREFKTLEEFLCQRGVHFYHGSKDCIDYRQPWILRSGLATVFIQQKEVADLTATLPPLLGIYLIATARERFNEFDQRGRFQSIANAVLDDVLERSLSVELLLRSATTFLVRKTRLRERLDYQEIVELVEQGYLRPILPVSGEDIYLVALPELLASELSIVLAQRIANKDDSFEVAHQLSLLTMSLPFGDIVCAQALLDLITEKGGQIPVAVLWHLLQMKPEQHELKPGSWMTGIVDGEIHDLKVRENNEIEVFVKGEGRRIMLPEGAKTISSSGWLILSQLSSVPMPAVNGDETEHYRIDQDLMLAVGTCPFPLVRPNVHLNNYQTHDDSQTGESYLCHRVGILEPVTVSILNLLFFFPEEAREWLKEAVSRKSQALLWRIAIALRELRMYVDSEQAKFALEAYDEFIRPNLVIARRHMIENSECSTHSNGAAGVLNLPKMFDGQFSQLRLATTIGLVDRAMLVQLSKEVSEALRRKRSISQKRSRRNR